MTVNVSSQPPDTAAGALRALLAGIIDYAGLFPPASLDMAATTRRYRDALDGDDAWMLGRLVVPAARLDELETTAGASLPAGDDAEPWRLSALVAAAGDPGLERDLERIAAFNAAHARDPAGLASIGTVELKARDAGAVEAALDAIPDALFPFFELPVADDPRGLLTVLSGSDAGAKVRTGGVEPSAYPSPAQLARFIAACAGADVPFKATAGLHHPLRRRSETVGVMEFGFLNVFAGAALARGGGLDEAALVELLTEESPEALTFDETAMRWRDRELSIERIDEARTRFAISFGSCSFQEPLQDLRTLGLL